MDNISLFNINALIGKGAYQIPDYADAAELIRHMDYLEIDRSIVSHVEARDLNPTWGNKRLLDEIAKPCYEQRLIPAFTIAPTCYYEKGALSFLKENLRLGKVKALRIFPDISRFPISILERVLNEIKQWHPVILWDCICFVSDSDIRDFSIMAEKFPEISFVITQKMWMGTGSVIDAMWRNKNIYIDISWMHMRDTANLIIDEFGTERVLFGIGYKSHNGAAIAALAHYQITPQQRELIAHGNIEKLLDLKPLKNKIAQKTGLLEQKPFWNEFKNGRPVKRIKIIDAHTHTTPFARGWYMRDIDPLEYTKIMIEQMDRLGVSKMLIIPENALFGNPLQGSHFWEEILKKHSDKFSGYLVFNPRYEKEIIPELDSFFRRKFYVGFKILPAYWKIPVTDVRYEKLWKYANKYHMTILVHAWDDSYNSPALLKDIVNKYSNVKFIIGHSGGGARGRLEAEDLASKHPNVYLEFCGSFTAERPFEDTIKIAGNNRIVFGSDTGGHDEAWELGRYLSMPVADEQLIAGLGTNIENAIKQSNFLK